MARKRRSDRYHLVYQLTAPTGERYVGVTFVRGDSRSMKARRKSAEARFKAHCRNALDYNHNTLLCDAIRECGPDAFVKDILAVIRGKKETHEKERELIAETQPELNMEGMGRKINSSVRKNTK
jgi:hypothetical protein